MVLVKQGDWPVVGARQGSCSAFASRLTVRVRDGALMLETGPVTPLTTAYFMISLAFIILDACSLE